MALQVRYVPGVVNSVDLLQKTTCPASIVASPGGAPRRTYPDVPRPAPAISVYPSSRFFHHPSIVTLLWHERRKCYPLMALRRVWMRGPRGRKCAEFV